ncbi:hypothetical protein MicloDRAFT_00046050 [Microvirga lotononidis]|uniref:Uncharacterized protein n=1 Tax=Microvirga lotononidis TaxID=864069 RepID=I4YVN6_9HYPH|nr:hypothetical protein MicloDRAFT_00046050 [Microvirga lotononidis]
MLLSKQVSLNLLFITLAYVSYVPWKAVVASRV